MTGVPVEPSAEMRELAHRMVDDALDYMQSAGERPVWTPVPVEVTARLKTPI